MYQLIGGLNDHVSNERTPPPPTRPFLFCIVLQIQPESHPAARVCSGETTVTGSGGISANGGGGGSSSRTGIAAATTSGGGKAAIKSAIVNVPARRGDVGAGLKENQERRAKLLADLGDGTVLVSWANTGVEEVGLLPPSRRGGVEREERAQLRMRFSRASTNRMR